MTQKSNTGILLLLVLSIGLLFVVPMFGMMMWGPIMMGRGMMGGWGYPGGISWASPTGLGWGFMFAGMLVPIIFIVLLVVGAYLLLSPKPGTTGDATALEILNERYAKGEISKEQYLEMKQHLTGK
jgi:putative membrane protein